VGAAWTNEQTSAIEARSSNLLVAAAAGSGKIVVGHIPFEGTPGTNLRKIAARDAVKYKEIVPEIILLQNELQELVL